MLDAKNLLIDGRRPGVVKEYQITYTEDPANRKCTVRYELDGNERILTCEIEAVTFKDG